MSCTADLKGLGIMPTDDDPRFNDLLAALPAADFDRLRTGLTGVDLAQGQALVESGEALQYAYFPTTAVLSLVCVLEDGSATEAAVVGFEGIVGVMLALSGASSPLRVVVQSAGRAWRAERTFMRDEFARAGAVQQLVLAFAQALMLQIAQTAACNRRHSIEQQLCRWLLLMFDRIPSDELHMTQETMAQMLGVRREGVTEAASKLQSAGLIRYGRGRIQLMDRIGLETCACECYRVVKEQYTRLLPAK